ncbi:MAG TPA: chemotaxis protein CheA [Gemmatimonadaceae bacterium]|nr:chemotaxis protein CheA [Gemmatimonadaceae bacterium]
MPKASRRTARSLFARFDKLSAAFARLGASDLETRGSLRSDAMALIERVPPHEARACVSLRLVAEALRTDRDRGDRQPALHRAAHALLDAVRAYLAAPDEPGRLTLLERPERSTIAIMRNLPETSPSLKPRTSDLIGQPDRSPRSVVAQSGTLPPLTLPNDTDRALLGDFCDEAREYIENAEAALLVLERDPDDAEAVQTVMRAFHSIKGTAGFLKLDGLVALAHHGESLLGERRRRDGFAGRIASLSLRALDALSDTVKTLDASRDGAPLAYPAGFLDVLRELEMVDATPVGSAPAAPAAPPRASAPSVAPRDAGAAHSARVRLDRLDALVDLVGELVVAHWMIAQDPASGHDRPEFARKVTHAGKLVRDLHDMSMGMRMVPLRGTCNKLVRLARDLAQRAGKQVDCQVDGEMTELDRNMVELVADPLMHMVRNAIDHGLETPDERTAAGKPAAGRLTLSATQVGGQVVIELTDDGRGLQRDRILQRAAARGIVRPGEQLSDTDILDLIFAPGLSTADQITDVSGRGVGMDVVRRNIQALHGRVEVQSVAGAGTTISLRVPLTLAITDGMLVRVGVERYIVPTTNVVVSFRPERGALFTVAGRGEMVRLRNDVLPLVRLHRLLDVHGACEDPVSALLMVVGAAERRCALLVDAILGQQQVVAKPVTAGIGDVPGIAGAAILGDGRVGLILDVPQLFELARRAHPFPTTQAVA